MSPWLMGVRIATSALKIFQCGNVVNQKSKLAPRASKLAMVEACLAMRNLS